MIFNKSIPQDLGFKDREDPDQFFELEIDQVVGKDMLGKIVYRCFKRYGATETSIILDKIKKTGFRYSTKSAISIGVGDIVIPEAKKDLLAEAEEQVQKIRKAVPAAA